MKNSSMSTDSENDYVICGHFGAAHGVRGSVKVFSDTSPKESLLNYKPWWIKTANGFEPLEFSNPKSADKYLLVTPKGCTDCDMAARYVNKEIFIPRSQFPKAEEGTYYWTDLFGCTVTNFDGGTLGVVVDIYDQHGTDVFVIEDAEKNRVQIPNLKPFIQSIDITHKKIQAHWEVI